MNTTTISRRVAGNVTAWQGGAPRTQSGIDNMWSSIVAKLNAEAPVSPAPGVRQSSAPRSSSAEDAINWGAITAELNAEAGLRAPAHVR